jgi:Flp pilus assembly protein TadD
LALGRLGNLLVRAGEFEAAQPLFEQALSLARALNDPYLVWNCLVHMATSDLYRGDFASAMRIFVETQRLARVAGDRVREAHILVYLSWLAAEQADYRTARAGRGVSESGAGGRRPVDG